MQNFKSIYINNINDLGLNMKKLLPVTFPVNMHISIIN